jgi:hypothetical protein
MPLTPEEIKKIRGDAGVTSPAVSVGQGKSLVEQLGISGSSTAGDDNATFQATGEENILQGGAKALGNTPKSAVNLVKNVADAVIHPADTVKNVTQTLVGAGEALAHKVGLGDPEDIRPEEEKFNQVVDFFKGRYGNLEKLKETAIEDPVGFAADLASIFSGGGGALTKAGEISKIGKVAEAGKIVSSAGSKLEPVSLVTNTVKDALGKVKNSPVGNIVADVSPTAYKMQQGQVVKALELTPGDLSTIKKTTGNDVTKFIVDNDLIKNSPEEIAHALNDKRKATMAEVRGEIEKVPARYSAEEIPNVKKGLDVVYKGISDTPGLEAEAAKVKALADKKILSLTDVQHAKELIDEHSKIYTKMGDAKGNAQAKGLDNIRKDLRSFIEKEVDVNTDGTVDIKKLNNDVATTYALEDAIENRAMRGLSRQHISALDLLVGTSGTAAFGPLAGAGILIAKKLAESPTTRLMFAKLLAKQPISFVKKVTKEMANKTLSADTQAKLQNMIDQVAKNAEFIESGANVNAQLNDEGKVDEIDSK